MAAKQQHPKGPCRNRECPRHLCQGYQLGYGEGFVDGLASCPGPHT
jgi:hypothetical protein